MEIGGHIRVHPHMTYHLGAAKLVVTGGQNVIFWHFRALKDTIPLKVLFQDRYSAIGDLTASNGNN